MSSKMLRFIQVALISTPLVLGGAVFAEQKPDAKPKPGPAPRPSPEKSVRPPKSSPRHDSLRHDSPRPSRPPRPGHSHRGHGWGDPYWWGGGWWWGWNHSGYDRYGFEPRMDGYASLDLDVEPEDAEVLLDGVSIGTADDFDGYPGYLYLESGRYRLEFRASGYEPWSKALRVHAGNHYDFQQKLRTGPKGGETGKSRYRNPPRASERFFGPDELSADDEESAPVAEPADVRSFRKAFSLSVTPDDAAVWLDGKPLGPARSLSGSVLTTAGEHELVVMKPGFETRIVKVKVDGDDEVKVDVELKEVEPNE